MYYSNYSSLNETLRAELVTKIENLTDAYRSNNSLTFYPFASIYHNEYVTWKVNET